MSPADLEQLVLERLRSFWRTRAALAFLRYKATAEVDASIPLDYSNLPACGAARDLLQRETVAEALDALAQHESSRMLVDAFVVTVAAIEAFLSDKLAARGLKAEGTLGYLQNAAQKAYGVVGVAVFLVDEVRERRNSFVHHGGTVTARYVKAAAAAAPHSSGVVRVPLNGSAVAVTGTYLTYVGDVLVRYAAQYPT